MFVRTLWPGNRVPITILLDDPTPCRNPMWYEFPDAGHTAVVPLGFVERFADMCARTGAAGKFSIVPCPGAQGRVDRAVPGIAHDDLEQFLCLIRQRIAPRWSIGPEMLTHGKAIDLDTGQVLPLREDAWAARQDERTLARYIAHALHILHNAGLAPTGVTSPWSFGIEVEHAYTGAIARALRDVCGSHLGWYFLHSDMESPLVAPHMVRQQSERVSALVSIVSGQRDWLWRTQYGEDARLDPVLSVDGAAGRLAQLFAGGGPIVLTTHWQSLFSNGSGSGLDALMRLCERVNSAWGVRVRWTSAQELAQHTVACATFRAVPGDDRMLLLTSPYSCREFTIALDIPASTTAVICDGSRLERCDDGAGTLEEGCWARIGNEAHVCFRLGERTSLSWQTDI